MDTPIFTADNNKKKLDGDMKKTRMLQVEKMINDDLMDRKRRR